MEKQRSSGLFLSVAIFSLFLFSGIFRSPALAGTVAFEEDYNYEAGEDDTAFSSRVIALMEVKRLLDSDLAAYLERTPEFLNINMPKERILVYAPAFARVDVISEGMDGDIYYIDARVVSDQARSAEIAAMLGHNLAKAKELETMHKTTDALFNDLHRLKDELEIADPLKRDALLKLHSETARMLGAMHCYQDGIFSQNNGMPNDAIEAFTRAIEYNKKLVYAYMGRADSYMKLDGFQLAMSDYNKAVEIDPSLGAAYLRRADLSNSIFREFESAVKDYTKAIELNPRESAAYFARGMIYFKKMLKFNLAIDDFSKFIELNPNSGSAYYYRGICYAHIGNNEKRINDFKKAANLKYELAADYLRRRGIEWQ